MDDFEVDSQTTTSSGVANDYPKDSFDRFGDDLCQLLVAYLPFEEHFRRECLSKQFQRCLYVSLKELIINSKLINKMGPNSPIDALIVILKKCPNIQTIDCQPNDRSEKTLILEIMDGLSDDYCQRLSRIECDLETFDEFVDKFFKKFGSKLMKVGIRFDENNENHDCLQYCHNLRDLLVLYFNDVFTADNRLLVHNLLAINFTPREDFSNEMFATFIANNKSLRSLNINWIDSNFKSIEMLSQITGLTQLKELILEFDIIGYVDFSLYHSFAKIGGKCRQLRRLSLEIRSETSQLNIDVMKAMKFMPQLRRLELQLQLLPDAQVVTDCHMFDAIYGFKRMTYLVLNLRALNDTLLAGIETNLRKLQYLSICREAHLIFNELDYKTFIMRSSPKLTFFVVMSYGENDPVVKFNDKQIYEMRHTLPSIE